MLWIATDSGFVAAESIVSIESKDCQDQGWEVTALLKNGASVTLRVFDGKTYKKWPGSETALSFSQQARWATRELVEVMLGRETKRGKEPAAAVLETTMPDKQGSDGKFWRLSEL